MSDNDNNTKISSKYDEVVLILNKGGYLERNNYVKIINICEKELTDCNNSAGSSLKKLAITFKLQSGEQVDKSIIWKSKRSETGPQDVTEILEAFPIESKMYGEVLASINKLLDTKDISKPWAEYYGSENNNILMEDLSLSGFTMKADRQMDFEHAKISIEELGKYHAMTMISVAKGMIDPGWFKPSMYARHIPFIMDLNSSAFNGLINSMKLHWGSEWERRAENIEERTEQIGDILHHLWHSTKGHFDVINHGEYWLNNLIFKYDNKGNVVDMRILDWQVSHYNSPCWDLSLFLFGSLNPDLREKHLEDLLQIYYEKFTFILKTYDYKQEVPSLSYFEETLDQMWIFCFLGSVTAPPWMLSSAKEGTYYEDDFSGKDILKTFHMPCYQWSSVREQMKKEVRYWMKRGKI